MFVCQVRARAGAPLSSHVQATSCFFMQSEVPLVIAQEEPKLLSATARSSAFPVLLRQALRWQWAIAGNMLSMTTAFRSKCHAARSLDHSIRVHSVCIPAASAQLRWRLLASRIEASLVLEAAWSTEGARVLWRIVGCLLHALHIIARSEQFLML
jgi:hypothetical protein